MSQATQPLADNKSCFRRQQQHHHHHPSSSSSPASTAIIVILLLVLLPLLLQPSSTAATTFIHLLFTHSSLALPHSFLPHNSAGSIISASTQSIIAPRLARHLRGVITDHRPPTCETSTPQYINTIPHHASLLAYPYTQRSRNVAQPPA